MHLDQFLGKIATHVKYCHKIELKHAWKVLYSRPNVQNSLHKNQHPFFRFVAFGQNQGGKWMVNIYGD